jgi:hypothetical protein
MRAASFTIAAARLTHAVFASDDPDCWTSFTAALSSLTSFFLFIFFLLPGLRRAVLADVYWIKRIINRNPQIIIPMIAAAMILVTSWCWAEAATINKAAITPT